MDHLRQTMLEGFAAVLDRESLTTLEELLPNRPWRETVPPEIWYRRGVLDQQDVRQRHELHAALERVVGADAAAATMEYLPPVSAGVEELPPRGGGDVPVRDDPHGAPRDPPDR